jgi:hypothetical protein
MDASTSPSQTPSPSTGIDDIPGDRRERILSYLDALLAGKEAGVCGEPIGHRQRFIDHVVRQRVADAHDDARWARRCAEMDDDERAWQRRIADRGTRGLTRLVTPSTTGSAAARVLRRAKALSDDQRERLIARYDEILSRDIDRATELLPELADCQPYMASIQWRSAEMLKAAPNIAAFRKLARTHPAAVQAAGLATFAGDLLPRPARAVLLGAWAEVVDDDPSVVEDAWTDAADDIRLDIASLDPSAFNDPLDDF